MLHIQYAASDEPGSHQHVCVVCLSVCMPFQQAPSSHFWRSNVHIFAEIRMSGMQAPTQAELDPQMEAIVVSEETLPGALHINSGRVVRGFAPLLVLVVPVIGSIDPAHKLSSTHLREADAAAAAERQ